MKTSPKNENVFKTIFSIVALLLVCSMGSYAQPLVANAGTSLTICSGSNGNIGGSPTASYGTGPYTYSWSPSAGLSSVTVSNPTASPASTTTYTVTVTDAVSASSASTVTVTVLPNPNVTVNSPTICQGSSSVLTAAGATTYNWAPSIGLSSTTTANTTANPTTTTSYTVTGTSGGCTATAVSIVTVNPLPSAPTASNNGPLCPGATLYLTASFVSGATYSWSGPGGYTAAIQNPTLPGITVSNAGTYYVTSTVAGCTSVAGSTNLVINSVPTANAGPDQTICLGNSVSFSASASGATTYSWDFGDGGTSTLLNPIHTYTTSGTFNAILYATNSSGCTTSDVVQIIVSGGPTLAPSVSGTSCFGTCDGTATISASGGIGTYTYYWSPGALTTPSASFLCAGSYTVSVTDAIGCGATTNVTITQPSVLSVSTSSSSITCNGACDGTTNVIVSGGTPAFTYLWSPGGITTQNASALCAGNYTVNITDGNGCNASGTVTLTQPSAVISNSGGGATICINDTSILNGYGIGGAGSYTYNWNDGATNYTTASISVNPASTTNYTLTVTDINGCLGSPSVTTVMVMPNTDIYGHVSYSGGALSSGINTVVLYKYLPVFTSFDTIQAATIDASGNYHFAGVGHGDYLIKAFNDTTAYPLLIPTYYDGQYLWDSAMVVMHHCSVNDTVNITMLEVPAISGPGTISGGVFETTGFIRMPGDPIPGVDIKLGRNPGGQLVAFTETDGGGQFSFNGLPVNLPGESYILYVDIPGLERDSTYLVTITATDTNFPNLNYTADSTTITPDQSTVGIHTISTKENMFTLYPNPAKENVSIEYIIEKDSEISLTISNILGVKVADIERKKQTAGAYKSCLNFKNYNLNSGVYFITLETSNKKTVQRLVITE